MEGNYLCKTCKTTERSKFYPSVTSKCKACKKIISTGYDRNPKTAKEVKCEGCNKVSTNPMNDFSISKVTGFYLDKCRICKNNSENPIPTMTFGSLLSESISFEEECYNYIKTNLSFYTKEQLRIFGNKMVQIALEK